jgi:hypothetical protein
MQSPSRSALEAYQEQIDASRHLADTVFNGTDRLEHLAIETARNAFDAQMRFYQALMAAQDQKSMTALQTAFISQAPEHMIKVQQELIKIVSDAQQQITGTMQRYRSTLGSTAPLSIPMMPTDHSGATNGVPASAALTSVYTLWEKAFKETLATANRTMATALGTAQSPLNTNGDASAAAPTSRRNGKRK